jgi:signal-transduction protein with cAMP-binding, CBS, and nucleotidyltransferase domain
LIVETIYKDEFKLIDYHKNLLGVNDRINHLEYINRREMIINTYLYFSHIDKNFNTPLLRKLLIDFMSLIEHSTNFTSPHGELYNQCSNTNLDFADFKSIVNKKEKQIKDMLITLINTKIYFFDLLIWHEVKRSKYLYHFIYSIAKKNLKSSKEFSNFFEIDKQQTPPITTDNHTIYTEVEKTLLFSLTQEKKIDESRLIQNLIKSKDKFKFFYDIETEEIEKIVNNVKLFTYQKDDTIIKQGQMDLNIYLLLQGECDVVIGNKPVSKVKQGQSFGELTPFSGIPRSAHIVANKTSKLISFTINFELAQREPHIFLKLYKNLVDILMQKIISTNNHITKNN